MTVTLTNMSGRCQVFVLAHETFCMALGECRCDLEQGRRDRRIARSLTLVSGVTSPELDGAVLSVPEVLRAAKRGELTVTRVVEQPTPRAVPAPPTSPEVNRPDPKAKKKRGAS